MVNVRGADIRDLPMPNLLPSEQSSRVESWTVKSTEIDRATDLLASQIRGLQEYKQSLITAAVTGEFDVTTASTKIPE